MELRETIREWRERAGLSQLELAKLVGMAQTRISEVERGRRRLQATELAKIADACGVEDGEWADIRTALAGA